MNPHSSPTGFGIVCHPEGRIQRFVRDDLQLADRYTGQPFKELLDYSSRAKAQAFLDAVRFTGAAFDWELDLRTSELPQTLHFVGGSTGEVLLICGIQSRQSVLQYLEELAGINGEQTILIRDAVKQMLATHSQRLSDAGIYDEMSRLNNELVNAQRQLQKQAGLLAQMNEEKNRALGVVAHDLRNPINIFYMYSEYLMLATADRLTEEEREMLRTLKKTAESMNRLVNDVLDVSAIEAGRLRLDRVTIDLVSFVDSLVKRLRPIARQSGVELQLEIGLSADFQLSADVSKLEQVLNNLIDNAVKFTPTGETVQIALTRQEEYVAVAVTDPGPGIDPDSLRTLFRPFVTGSSSSRRGTLGTGLGLSIAKRIVEGHGGRIDVQTAVGEGTCFRILLPA